MKSASVIKLFIMAAVYEQVDHGELELTNNIETLMKQMITVSHNESSNELVRLLSPTGDNHEDGMKVVNQYAEKYGYTDTNQGRDMLDYREVPAKGENYTSVEDTALLLREIYRGTCVNEEYSRVMLNLLKQQERTWKIPAGLPQGVKSANKTGELPDTENDAAIVFGETTDYILCVMAQGLANTSQAQKNIQNISGVVYKYFN
ncbi:MAG: serine hydrolase [Lachnospiraceae bacterium]|nr:serine hydrolase [Lachnospiraceae bacterium]